MSSLFSLDLKSQIAPPPTHICSTGTLTQPPLELVANATLHQTSHQSSLCHHPHVQVVSSVSIMVSSYCLIEKMHCLTHRIAKLGIQKLCLFGASMASPILPLKLSFLVVRYYRNGFLQAVNYSTFRMVRNGLFCVAGWFFS